LKKKKTFLNYFETPLEGSKMSLFLDNFWDGNGFDVLNKRLQNENEFISNLANLVHSKANLDADYSKGLMKLVKNFSSSGKDETGTMKALWETIRMEIENQAKLISTLATELDDQIAKSLAAFRDEQSKNRKNVEKKVNAAEKNYSSAKSNQKKLEKSFLSQEKTLESCHEAFERSNDPKTEKNLRKAEKDSAQLEKEYKGATKKAHFEKVKWEEAMIQMSLEFEQIERERYTVTKDHMVKFSELHKKVVPSFQESNEKIAQSAETLDGESDLRTFVDQKKTGSNRPEELLYRSYASDNRNPMKEDRRRTALAKAVYDIEQDVEAEKKGIAGVENLLKVYSNQPSYTNDAGMITSQRQLAHMQEYLILLQSHLKTHEDYLASIGGSAQAYVPSPSPSQQSSWEDSPSTPAASGGGGGGGAGEAGTCKALYDFTASNEGELNFKEGDVMTVLDTSDPDWLRVQLGDTEGYVPANYVALN